MRKIKVIELEQLFSRIIEKLKVEKVEKIELDSDFYRFIPTDKWDSYEDDIALVGSLYDDWDSLKEILEDSDRAMTYVDFDRIASILRIVSEIENPTSST